MAFYTIVKTEPIVKVPKARNWLIDHFAKQLPGLEISRKGNPDTSSQLEITSFTQNTLKISRQRNL